MATNVTAERERLKTLLRDTVTLLCKNSLVYQDELKVYCSIIKLRSKNFNIAECTIYAVVDQERRIAAFPHISKE